MHRIDIQNEADIVRARHAARDMAAAVGLSLINKTRVATAVSELARNVYKHGGGGYVEIFELENGGRQGLQCNFVDNGPGIPDVDQAMGAGFSSTGTLGHGLPGSKRLMDDLKIASEVGKGTRVETVKWK